LQELLGLADILKARNLLGYELGCTLTQGLKEAAEWYVENCPTELRVKVA